MTYIIGFFVICCFLLVLVSIGGAMKVVQPDEAEDQKVAEHDKIALKNILLLLTCICLAFIIYVQ